MKTKLDELKRFVANIEKEEHRLSCFDRNLTSMTDLEFSFAMRTVQARKTELREEIRYLENSN